MWVDLSRKVNTKCLDSAAIRLLQLCNAIRQRLSDTCLAYLGASRPQKEPRAKVMASKRLFVRGCEESVSKRLQAVLAEAFFSPDPLA
jgi:hypothetical protein